jgi:hypothetical protein
MMITRETNIHEIEFWAGAATFADELSWNELETIGDAIEELYPQGLSETQLNDILWFDTDWCCELLGYKDYDDFIEQRAK